jgi:hypothetical protein
MYVVQVFDQFTKKCFGCFWLNGLFSKNLLMFWAKPIPMEVEHNNQEKANLERHKTPILI